MLPFACPANKKDTMLCLKWETKQINAKCTCMIYALYNTSIVYCSAILSSVRLGDIYLIILNRAETIRSAHDTIRCTRYDTFRNTFAILTWEAEACDSGLRPEALHSTDYNCLRSNDAQWLQQWRPPRSFQMQCVCDELTHFIGIYWLFSVVSRVRF